MENKRLKHQPRPDDFSRMKHIERSDQASRLSTDMDGAEMKRQRP